VVRGLALNQQPDQIDPSSGKWPILTNVRSYTAGVIEPRPGLISGNTIPASAGAIHSLRRLNDFNPNAPGQYTRILGAGPTVYTATGLAPVAAATGFSGHPLALVPFRPDRDPNPWMYIYDGDKLGKVRVDGIFHTQGLEPSTAAPTANLDRLNLAQIAATDGSDPWAAWGTGVAAPAIVQRLDAGTTITTLLRDVDVPGGVAGWISIVPSTLTVNTQPGMFLAIGGANPETVFVQEVKIAVGATTVAGILYDAGNTGFCTIQPAASLAAGSIGAISGASSTEQSDNPAAVLPEQLQRESSPLLDALVVIGGETVRVLSTSLGPDGTQSFRAYTVGAHGAGEALAGVSSLRVYAGLAHNVGDPLSRSCVQFSMTQPNPAVPQLVGGVQLVKAVDCSIVNLTEPRPVQPEDYIHVSLQIDRLDLVQEGRIKFDIDATTNDFLHNYLYSVFRANDLQTATPITDPSQPTQSLLTATTTRQQRDVTDNQIQRDRGGTVPNPPGLGADSPFTGLAGTSGQLATGRNQWFELRIRVKDLLRSGTDLSRTLRHVAAIQVQLTCGGHAAESITCKLDSLWIGGTFGPDVGVVGLPYLYTYRPRSSLTGVKGNPAPPTRSGVLPRRQPVRLQATPHPNPAVDLLDWFRFGGSVESWRYLGSCPNASGAFRDVFPDDLVTSAEPLEFDNYQPFPTPDKPYTGTCTVVGTSVLQTGGDAFSLAWAPGSTIIINGVATELYAAPRTNQFLEIVDSLGAQMDVPFYLPSPTKQGVTCAAGWGDFQGYFFACVDPYNPGFVHVCKAYDPDASSESLILEVTTPSEPLQNGCIFDNQSFTFSIANLYWLEPAPGVTPPFVARKTACTKGLWAPWGLAVGPRIWFISDDGIYETTGGEAISITDEDLYPLFPHQGVPGRAVNGYQPPDMTRVNDMRLGYANKALYFDYVDVLGAHQTLVYNTITKGWVHDKYTPDACIHVAEEGPFVESVLVGCVDGRFYQVGSISDNGVDIAGHVRTPSVDSGDPRSYKLYSDVEIKIDTGGGAVNLLMGFNDFTQVYPLAAPITQQGLDLVSVNILGGAGQSARNIALDLQWSGVSLWWEHWQPAALIDPMEIAKGAWQTQSSGMGLPGFKHVRDGYIAYAATAEVLLTLVIDTKQYQIHLPSTNGVYTKYYLTFPGTKGKIYTWYLTSASNFFLYPRDCEFHARAWGDSGPYVNVNPFLDSYANAA
jgi:hypothetical protein